jgi:type VI secretion system protein ImpA
MPLRNDLLNPISEASPGGENLYYSPVYDKIKEARREDEDAPQGQWQHERKLADWPLVIKLAGEALATKSKDLQLAAWLTEAMLRREGIAGLREGLDLLRGLIENFWEHLYPELEDGDAEFRATPVQWIGDRLEEAIRRAPLTRSGLDWFKYKESRTVGYEQDAEGNEQKQQARQTAIQEGKITAEEFDAAFAATPKAFYVQLMADLDGALESVEALGQLCEEKFGDAAPSFGRLRSFLNDVRQDARILLQKKRQVEPDEDAAAEEAVEETAEPEPAYASYDSGAAAAPARAPARKSLAEEPADREDAVARIIAAARYLRREDPYNPAPYLMLRGLRWGELRAGGESPDAGLLAAPPGGIRQELKRLSVEGQWEQVLETGENAMGLECGRAWLDLQRYACRACSELGSYYDPVAAAIRSALRSLLQDLPQLTELTLLDDTATANAETMAWIREQVTAGQTAGAMPPMPAMDTEPAEAAPGEAAPVDAFYLAMQAARGGNAEEGIEILVREAERERSGRGRFQRKVQLAQLCLSSGHDNIAYPILEDLAAEIERRGLEDWEPGEVLAHPLALLFRCLNSKRGEESEQLHKLYARICRLDPLQALACSR